MLTQIRRLADRGLAVLVISHNLNDVFRVSDRVAVLHLGRMVGVHPTGELTQRAVVDLITLGSSAQLAPGARWPRPGSRLTARGAGRAGGRTAPAVPDRRPCPVTGPGATMRSCETPLSPTS